MNERTKKNSEFVWFFAKLLRCGKVLVYFGVEQFDEI